MGVVLSFSGKAASRAAQFLFGIWLARLLAPSDFGLLGMTSLFIVVPSLIVDCGFAEAIVRKPGRTDRDFSTVFWSQNAFAWLAFAALFLLAPSVSAFYREPRLTWIIRLTATGIPFFALSSMPYTRLRLARRFGLIAAINVASVVVSGLLAVFLAWKGHGVKALVWQGISWSAVYIVLLYGFAKWLPRDGFSVRAFREFFAFGWKLLASGFLGTVYTHLFSAAIGRSLGAAETGYFNRSQYYTHEFGSLVAGSVEEVEYPALAALQGDRRGLCRRFLRDIGWTGAVIAVFLLVLAVFTRPVVLLLVGEQWLPCVPCIRLLAIGGLCEPLRQLTLIPMYVNCRTDLVLILDLFQKPLGIAMLFVSLPFGVLAVCASKAAVAAVSLLINLIVWWQYFVFPAAKTRENMI